MEDQDAQRANDDLTRLTLRNREELDAADRYVSELGTIDDFRELLEPLLRTTFHGWDDGGALVDTRHDTLRVTIPRRLRAELGAELPRATFNRQVAVASQETSEEEPIAFLTPAHPLIDATLRAIRDDARNPEFAHRFDVGVDADEGLIFSFVGRYVDGESRTADERLLAVEMSLDGMASQDSDRDFVRLGISQTSSPGRPDPERITAWRGHFEALAEEARVEAERRTAAHLRELDRIAAQLSGEEREALGRWKSDEKARIEKISFGTAMKLSFDQLEVYEDRVQRLESEYERRLETLRDRSEIRLASLELLGGRLLVMAAT